MTAGLFPGGCQACGPFPDARVAQGYGVPMITATHTLIYSVDPPATRSFFKDVLRWPFVSDERSSDVGDASDPSNWLIFATGPSELGVHPTSGEGWSTHPHHEVSLVCDDLAATMAELAGRGAEFSGEPEERGYGLGVEVKIPGTDDIQLYQPHHATAYHLS